MKGSSSATGASAFLQVRLDPADKLFVAVVTVTSERHAAAYAIGFGTMESTGKHSAVDASRKAGVSGGAG